MSQPCERWYPGGAASRINKFRYQDRLKGNISMEVLDEM